MDTHKLYSILSQFQIRDCENAKFKVINQGYINDTFFVGFLDGPSYILQRINTTIFKNVDAIHKNLEIVLPHLSASDYQDVCLINTKSNTNYLIEGDQCWRMWTYVDNSVAYNFTSNKVIAFEAGKILGRFHMLLEGVNLINIEDTLPQLNFLPSHISAFHNSYKKSSKNLCEKAKSEIEFALKHETSFSHFYKANLPQRVCHNDTKLNNILFNNNTNKASCFIDLDTIMNGYFHYDFGDIVRTVVSESREDETDLSKINFNLELFDHVIHGLRMSKLELSQQEIDFLPISCSLLPFMHGIRALTDFLNGNIHYKVSYENQNLDRSKSLFRVAQLALERQKDIIRIVDKLNVH